MAHVMPTGIIPALSTPTTEKGILDEKSLRSLVHHNILWGSNGLAVSIVAGEFSKFSDREREKSFSIVVEAADGKLPVWAGISHLGTDPAIELGRAAKDVGVDGVIAMPALFGKESTLALHEHFSKILDRVDLPLMIQDSEDFNGIHMCATHYAKLANEYDNLVSVKIEGALSMQKILDVKTLLNNRLSVLGGMAAMTLFEESDLGADGNVPGSCLTDLLVEAYVKYKEKKKSEAIEAFSRYRRWVEFGILHMPSFAEIEKQTLRIRGVIDSANTRSPHVPLSDSARSELKQIILDLGLLKPK